MSPAPRPGSGAAATLIAVMLAAAPHGAAATDDDESTSQTNTGHANTSQANTNQEAAAALAREIAKLQQELERQRAQLEVQAQEIERLRQQVEESQGTAARAKVAAQDAPRVSVTNARPTIASADGRASFSPRAVVQLDAAKHEQSSDGGAVLDFRRGSVGAANNRETNAARDLSDGAYFRRARLGFEGSIARDFSYRLMLELGGSGTEGPTRINDAWIAYSGFAPFTLQLGAFSPPANMDDGTGVESSLFIERATPAELSRALGGADGRIGLGVRGSGSRWMSSLTLTTRTAGDAEVFDSQLATVARVGWLAATAADYNLHTGLSGTWVLQPADQGSAIAGARYATRFRDRPELRVDSTRLIDTGSIDADAAYAAGIEIGANWKNWYLQAENFWFGVERPHASALSDPVFGGYYVQGSWLITGESRRYEAAAGAFQAPRPFVPATSSGGRGAWELALRYSHTDLDYREGVLSTAALVDSVRGGTQDILALGVNWYLNANFKLAFNYLNVDVDRLNPAGPGNLAPFGPSPATPPVGAEIGQELDIFALRSQFSF